MNEKLPDESRNLKTDSRGLTALEAIKRHVQHSLPSSLRAGIVKKLDEVKDGTSSGEAEATT